MTETISRPPTARPFWSVMIPIYRPDLSLLRETLESALAAATDEAMQLALVQDSSPEGETELSAFLEEFRERGVEVYVPVGRLGLGGNWNRCIELARGHVVHILHQDDRVLPGFYAAHEAAFRAEPSIGASFTQHAFIDAKGKHIHQGHLDQPEAGILDDWYEYLVANFAVQCPSIVVRRLVYERLGGFDVSYRYAIDRAMWQRIASTYPIWFDPRPLAECRMHEADETAALRSLLLPMRETRRVIAEGLELVSPAARNATMQSARVDVMGPNWENASREFGRGRVKSAIASLIGLIAMGRLHAYHALFQRQHLRAPLARPRSLDLAGDPRKRITVVTEFFPYQPERNVFGVFARLGRIIAALEEVGDVDLVFFWHRLSTLSDIEQAQMQVRRLWPSVKDIRFVPYGRRRRHFAFDALWALRLTLTFHDPRPTMGTTALAPVRALRHQLSELQPDLIVAHRIGPGAAFLRAGGPMPPIIVDVDDLEHIKIARLAQTLAWGKGRLTHYIWSLLARQVTQQVGSIASQLIVTSDLDRGKLQALCPKSVVTIVPNTAARLADVGEVETTGPIALFVGTFGYGPNVEGANWLISEVWPRVHRAVPNARLIIVGEGGDRLLSTGSGGIEVKGFVADLAPIYRLARIAVCPILRGAGTRIKIIEAAMNGRASVATTVGAEGLAFAPGLEIILADSPYDFAGACVRLLDDAGSASKLGAAAQTRAQAVYERQVAAKALTNACLNELEKTAALSARRGPRIERLN